METSAAARQAKESLELAFQMSQILDTGLDRHTLSLLMALCDRRANPEALAALVRDLSSAAASPVSNATAVPTPTTPSLFPPAFDSPRLLETGCNWCSRSEVRANSILELPEEKE